MIKASLDATAIAQAYGQALRRMAALTGFDQKSVLLGEAGIILKTAAGRTKVAKAAEADLRTRLHVIRGYDYTGGKNNRDSTITVSAGLRGPFGRVWKRKKSGTGWRRTHDANFAPLNYHYKKGDWIDLQEAIDDVKRGIQRDTAKGRNATGLARQSWVQIADALNIDLGAVQGGGSLSSAGIAKARAAIATTGRPHQNGSGTALGDQEKTVVMLVNRLPYGTAIGFDRTLLTIMAGRAGYFRKSYENGAFDTMTKAARAFPWLKVTRSGGG